MNKKKYFFQRQYVKGKGKTKISMNGLLLFNVMLSSVSMVYNLNCQWTNGVIYAWYECHIPFKHEKLAGTEIKHETKHSCCETQSFSENTDVSTTLSAFYFSRKWLPGKINSHQITNGLFTNDLSKIWTTCKQKSGWNW